MKKTFMLLSLLACATLASAQMVTPSTKPASVVDISVNLDSLKGLCKEGQAFLRQGSAVVNGSAEHHVMGLSVAEDSEVEFGVSCDGASGLTRFKATRSGTILFTPRRNPSTPSFAAWLGRVPAYTWTTPIW